MDGGGGNKYKSKGTGTGTGKEQGDRHVRGMNAD